MATMPDDPTFNMTAPTVLTIPATNVGDGYDFGNVGQNLNASALLPSAVGAYVLGGLYDADAVPSYAIAYHPFPVAPNRPVYYPPPPLQVDYPAGVPYGAPGAVLGVYSYTPYFYGRHHPSEVIAHQSYPPPLGASEGPSHPPHCSHVAAPVAATSHVRRRI